MPISVYNKGRKIKVEIALVKGKKKQDKRETIKNAKLIAKLARDKKQRIKNLENNRSRIAHSTNAQGKFASQIWGCKA